MFGGDGLWQTLIIRNRVAELEATIDSMEAVNAQMQMRIDGLTSGDKGIIEEEARSQGFVKPGEKIYLMQPEGEKKSR